MHDIGEGVAYDGEGEDFMFPRLCDSARGASQRALYWAHIFPPTYSFLVEAALGEGVGGGHKTHTEVATSAPPPTLLRQETFPPGHVQANMHYSYHHGSSCAMPSPYRRRGGAYYVRTGAAAGDGKGKRYNASRRGSGHRGANMAQPVRRCGLAEDSQNVFMRLGLWAAHRRESMGAQAPWRLGWPIPQQRTQTAVAGNSTALAEVQRRNTMQGRGVPDVL